MSYPGDVRHIEPQGVRCVRDGLNGNGIPELIPELRVGAIYLVMPQLQGVDLPQCDPSPGRGDIFDMLNLVDAR